MSAGKVEFKTSSERIAALLKTIILSEDGQKAINKNWNKSMPTLNQMLDIVLVYMSTFDYNEMAVADYHLVKDLKENNLSEVNIRQCIDHLIIDGYAGIVPDFKISVKDEKLDTVPGYYITINGVKFINGGGYTSKWNMFKRFCRKHWFNLISAFLLFATLGLTWSNSNDKEQINNLEIKLMHTNQQFDSLHHYLNIVNQQNVLLMNGINDKIVQQNKSLDSAFTVINSLKKRKPSKKPNP